MLLRVGAVLLLVIAIGGAVNYFRPIPAASPTALLPASDVVSGTPPVLPWPARGSGAVAVSGLGLVANSGNETAIAAASVTKVMTALVLLEDKPLKKGENGPAITLTDVDVQSYRDDLAGNQSTVPVRAGEQLTELQALEGMLVPSANNLAETLARWDAGTIPAFVTKMNARAAALHLSHTRFTDVSGASPDSVSTPSDLVTLGMTAMQTQEVIAQVVSLGQVDLPVAGTVYNVDSALGQSGIVGIKTGSGLSSGANFLFAANATVDERTIVVYGCVMGQSTLDAAFAAAKTLIGAMSAVLHVRRVITRYESVVATYVTAWGAQTDLVSTVDVDLAEWPGMILRQRLEARTLVVDQPIGRLTPEGTEHLSLGGYSVDVPLVTKEPLYPPGRFWRLTRLTV